MSKISPQNLIKSHKYWRLVEMVPGILTWSAFFFIIFGSLLFPVFTADLIIAYTLIWVFRTFHFAYNLSKSFHFSQRAQKVDWNKLLIELETPENLNQLADDSYDHLILENKGKSFKAELLERVGRLQKSNNYLKPSQVVHCITLVRANESYEVVKSSLDSYAQSNYDLKKVIFMFACEESQKESAENIYNQLKKEYGDKFQDFLVSYHPSNLPNELRGRAGNATWSAKELKKYLDHKKISYDHVILSSFDADTVISQYFLSELTYRYCITENRVEVGYQPVPFYHNNIWDVPVFNRLVAISCSFWQLSVSLRKDENKSFSSRSMSFQSVIDFDYWDTRVVQDDSRQFWTAFFVYNGRHYLENIYSPVYMDAVLSESYLSTIKSQYKQLRRWAWGVSDFPFIVFNMLASKEIPWTRKIYECLHFLESVFFWATGPVILLFAGAVPSIVNSAFRDTVLSHNLPIMMSNLMNIASIGIIICIIISARIIPFETQKSAWKKTTLFLQWLLVPIVSVCLSAIPAIDAQTRLILNKRLDFNITQKSRKAKV